MTNILELPVPQITVLDYEKTTLHDLLLEAYRSPDRRGEVLDALLDTIRKIKKCDEQNNVSGTGSIYSAELTPEQHAAYYPEPWSPRRQPSAEEVERAKSWWDTELERGKGLRAAALAKIGPLLRPSEVADRLGVSKVTVNNWRHGGKLLAIQLDDSQYLYPAFQFADSPDKGERGILRHFEEILTLLPYNSAWDKARFFLRRSPALDGRTPLEVLDAGDALALERLHRVAQDAGEMGS